jgi:hypothetical protein
MSFFHNFPNTLKSIAWMRVSPAPPQDIFCVAYWYFMWQFETHGAKCPEEEMKRVLD